MNPSCRRRLRPGAWLLSTVIAACASAPRLAEGIATDVVLLPGGFVRFEGQRVPVETFVVEIRRRVRHAAGVPARFPAVRILVEGAVPSNRLDALLRELQAAGVRHVTLG